MAATSDLVPLSKAGKILGITRHGVGFLIAKKQLKPYHVGNFTFVSQKHVEQLLLTRGGPGKKKKQKNDNKRKRVC